MKDYNKRLADNIRVERARQKITQEKLSVDSEISIDTISAIERGRGNPTIFTILSIARAMNIDIKSLIPSTK